MIRNRCLCGGNCTQFGLLCQEFKWYPDMDYNGDVDSDWELKGWLMPPPIPLHPPKYVYEATKIKTGLYPPVAFHHALQCFSAKKSICSLHLSQMVSQPSFSSASLLAHFGITR